MPWRPWQHGDHQPYLTEQPLGHEEDVYVSDGGIWTIRKVTEFRLFKQGVPWGVFPSIDAAQARVTLDEAAAGPPCAGAGDLPWRVFDDPRFGQCVACDGWYELVEGRLRRHYSGR